MSVINTMLQDLERRRVDLGHSGAFRYVRALRRKLSDFVLNKKQVAKDGRALTFVASLKKSDLAMAYQYPERLSLAAILNIDEVKRLCIAAGNGEHSGYLQRLFAVEAILQKVQATKRV